MTGKVKQKIVAIIKRKYRDYGASFTEKQRRLWAAAEAREIGHGGITCVHEATGISRVAIHAGLNELHSSKKKDLG